MKYTGNPQDLYLIGLEYYDPFKDQNAQRKYTKLKSKISPSVMNITLQ